MIQNCSTGQNIEDNWGTEFGANEWQLALLLAIAISPLILLGKLFLNLLFQGERS